VNSCASAERVSRSLRHRLADGLRPNRTDSAVETYEAAVRWLIENIRDHAKFPVVWAELKTYGFERNALGLRRIALLSSGVGVLTLAAGAIAGALVADLSIGISVALAGACALVGLWWWRVPSENRVRAAGDRYAAWILDSSAVRR